MNEAHLVNFDQELLFIELKKFELAIFILFIPFSAIVIVFFDKPPLDSARYCYVIVLVVDED